MAKSKGNYHKKKRRSQSKKQIQQSSNNGNKNFQKPIENKNVYTKEYLDYKHQQENTKPLILRIFVVALACIILLGFVIAPLF